MNVATMLPSSSPNKSGSLIGRTKGAVFKSVRSALGESGEYLQELSNKIGSVFTSSFEDNKETINSNLSSSSSLGHPLMRPPTPPPLPSSPYHNDNKNVHYDQTTAIKRKHLLPRCNNAVDSSFEDYESMTRHKLEKDNYANASRSRKKYPPGMSYEEISSSRSLIESEKKEIQINEEIVNSPDRDSIESIEPLQEKDIRATGPDPYEKLNYKIDIPCSSDSTSDQDGYGPSTSLDSNMDGRRIGWERSGSSGSVQSWASSLSADSQSEEAAADFMKSFVPLLFDSPNSINQEQKAHFGQMVLTESGRIWFARVVNARRARPCVSEASFYSLAQHFAVALFECHEADDFAPAKSLMNMCFTFYHEVNVPGLEPYKEYLYIHLRVQPIWKSMRFWTAAFFDAVQYERATRPVSSYSSNSHSNKSKSVDHEAHAVEDKKFLANIVFGQLGSFTCNMHAFGLSRNLCLEFLRKQCMIANLTQEQEKTLRDNIMRMFDESEPWR
ncbi:uncharacterized protein KIAA0513 isoform X2 [Chelonus insularis]|uniref:uncharacterized protein KIAA0513 isoform X2 n=1 Tax=Chelonus insularis TaxID=460826 RepID=UPI00158E65FD|nr:uncharacterized protein KIAA0513 isoform X2 [Chelonus insularis]